MSKAHFDTPKGAQQMLLDHLEAFVRRIGLESDKMDSKLVPKWSENLVKNVLKIEFFFGLFQNGHFIVFWSFSHTCTFKTHSKTQVCLMISIFLYFQVLGVFFEDCNPQNEPKSAPKTFKNLSKKLSNFQGWKKGVKWSPKGYATH